MKGRILLWILLPLILSCAKQNWSIPVTACSIGVTDSSANNVKARIYQQVLNGGVATGLPGIVLLVQTPKEGVWIGAAGKAKIETGEPMMPCSINHSGSVAKMYMGTA